MSHRAWKTSETLAAGTGSGESLPALQGTRLAASGEPALTHDSAFGVPIDRAAERALRDEVRESLGRLLNDRQLITPRPEDEQRIRLVIRERVAAHRRAAATGGRRLDDAEGIERRLFDWLLRLGPLQPLLDLPGVEEVIVNNPGRIFVVEDGCKRLIPDLFFDSDEEVRQLVKRAIGPLGRRLDESSPMVDARLPDGSRLNAAIPPATTRWCVVTIRKFVLRAHSLEQLVALGALPVDAAGFLEAAVQAGANVIVSGPTASGKTTLLNALGAAIASIDERIVTIEETAELTLERQLPDCVALQARASNIEGTGEVTIRQLVRNALRMRPTRIVIGEARGAEALDMLLAMNTGHEGSLSTLHANSPRDALARLVTLASMAEERLSTEALIGMVARTIDLVVQLRSEPRGGRRRVVSIFEVAGREGDVITGNDLWALDPQNDRLRWTGIRPRCLTTMATRGVSYALPPAPAVLLAGEQPEGVA